MSDEDAFYLMSYMQIALDTIADQPCTCDAKCNFADADQEDCASCLARGAMETITKGCHKDLLKVMVEKIGYIARQLYELIQTGEDVDEMRDKANAIVEEIPS